jgi:hypothetical protein
VKIHCNNVNKKGKKVPTKIVYLHKNVRGKMLGTVLT